MLRNITAKQLNEWLEYSRLEPFGERRGDWRAALVAATVYNMAVEAKDRKPVGDPMFLLNWETEEAGGEEEKETKAQVAPPPSKAEWPPTADGTEQLFRMIFGAPPREEQTEGATD